MRNVPPPPPWNISLDPFDLVFISAHSAGSRDVVVAAAADVVGSGSGGGV